jgi:2-hydroxychromene-2-carboxylate isomerase
MDAIVDLFWSFRSPYSYLAIPGYDGWEREICGES